MKRVLYLCLDLAPAEGSVALYQPQGNTLERAIPGSLRHTEQIIPVIDSILKEAATSLDALAGIILNRGPGSFTGLRVAFSSAKALAHSKKLPFFSVSGSEARALAFLNTHPGLKPSSLRVVTCLTQEKYLVHTLELEERLLSRGEMTDYLLDTELHFLIDLATHKALGTEGKNISVFGSRASELGLAFSQGKSRKDYVTEKELIEAAPEYYGTARYATKN